jgi:hypothetical protein
MPDGNAPDDESGTRWLIIGFVVCMVLGLGVLGWFYRPTDKTPPICANAEARCDENRS